jgi:hypothetical protein
MRKIFVGEQASQHWNRSSGPHEHQLSADEVFGISWGFGLEHGCQAIFQFEPGRRRAVRGNNGIGDRREKVQVGSPIESFKSIEGLI